VGSIADIKKNWEIIKKTEGKGADRERFAGITSILPALLGAKNYERSSQDRFRLGRRRWKSNWQSRRPS